MRPEINSDYGSGSSVNSSTSWGSLEAVGRPSASATLRPRGEDRPRPKSSSFADLVMGRCTLSDVMQEFRQNGSDSPYNPEEEQLRQEKRADTHLVGLGPATAYLRQKSWPAPERSPAERLPRPRPAAAAAAHWLPSATAEEFTPRSPSEPAPSASVAGAGLSEEQRRVLRALPDAAVYALLRQLEASRRHDQLERRLHKRQPEECRFCKNNGERELFYRSHQLKDGAGRVRCPVLRAFVCQRCGASGDTAHTVKYCPLTTNEERMKAANMMRSVRMASGRRRGSLASPVDASEHYVVFGETSPSALLDNSVFNVYSDMPLEPSWAALEKKLLH